MSPPPSVGGHLPIPLPAAAPGIPAGVFPTPFTNASTPVSVEAAIAIAAAGAPSAVPGVVHLLAPSGTEPIGSAPGGGAVVPIRRVFVANRGEAASRFITGARDYALERGEAIEVVVMYTDVDANAPYVQAANESIFLGPDRLKDVPEVDADGNPVYETTEDGQPKLDDQGRPKIKTKKLLPFLDLELIIRLAKEQGCDAVWPGWGWLSEKSELPDAVQAAGFRFIGPSGEAMRALGDKIGSKRLAQTAGVPVTPWCNDRADTLDVALSHAERVGYPVVIKATAGGGGGGMSFANSPEELRAKYQPTRDDARRKFANDIVFVERAIVKTDKCTPRHVEVQIFGDRQGNVVAVGDRDCTMQRKNQKVIEEAPAPGIPDDVRAAIHEAAVRIAKKVNYMGAGTVEFLYIPETGEFFFMEMNTRLQVEHTITEVVTGVDLVREQIRVAEGHPLSFSETPEPRGVAFQMRINFEDPEVQDPEGGFAATGGRLDVFRPPRGPGIRNDVGVQRGMTIPVGFDPMGAKLIAHGPDRRSAVSRSRRALAEYAIDGVRTNIGLHLEIMGHPDFEGNRYWTQWLRDYMAARKPWEAKPFHPEAILAAAVLAKKAQEEAYGGQLLRTFARGKLPQLPPRKESSFEFRLYGHIYPARVLEYSPGRYRVETAGRVFEVALTVRGPSEYEMKVDGKKIRVVGSERDGRYSLSLSDPNTEGSAFLIDRPPTGDVVAPFNGTIRMLDPETDKGRTIVRPGDMVREGQVIAMIEAMKMEQEVKTTASGRLEGVFFTRGEAVREGQKIIRINMDVGEQESPRGPPIRFVPKNEVRIHLMAHPDPTVANEAQENILRDPDQPGNFREAAAFVKQALLGFDPLSRFSEYVPRKTALERVPSAFNGRVRKVLEGLIASGGVSSQIVTETVDEVLRAYMDVELLFQKGIQVQRGGKSPSEEFYKFLQTRTAEGEFEKRLKAAVAHFGITGETPLNPSPELDRALVQMLLCHQEAKVRQEVMQAFFKILGQAEDAGLLDADHGLSGTLEKFSLLDRESAKLVHAAEGLLFSLQQSRLAEEGRERADREVHDLMRPVGELLDDEAEREVIDQLAVFPTATGRPLVGYILGDDLPKARIASTALAKRSYGGRHTILSHNLEQTPHGPLTTLKFVDGRSRVRRTAIGVFTGNGGSVDETMIDGTIRRGFEALEQARRGEETSDNVLEIAFSSIEIGVAEGDRFAGLIAERLSSVPTELHLKRVTVTAYSRDGRALYFNFYRDPKIEDRLVENRDLRHIHPFHADQMELWRYQRYWRLEKIFTPWDNNFLFLATERETAPDQEPDRRLLAFSFVNEVSPEVVMDPSGWPSFPEVDLAFGQAVHTIREPLEGLSRDDPSRERLEADLKKATGHRVNLIIRPGVTLGMEAIEKGIKRLTPRARGLSIDQTTLRLLRWRPPESSSYEDVMLRASAPGGTGLHLDRVPMASQGYVRPRGDLDRHRAKARDKRVVYPYDYIDQLVANHDHGEGRFQELDIRNPRTERDPQDRERVRYDLLSEGVRPLYERYPGEAYKKAPKIVFGLVTRKTARHPEGVTIIQIANDPTTQLCPLEEPECSRIIAAIDYAEAHGLEVDWKATSSGAGISMQRGTENLDWTARVAARIGEFTKGGGVINILVDGTNIGAQSYWDSIATMLMKTGGLLIKTARSFTALTGNEAQIISGSTPAEDNLALAGAKEVTGPIGQAQIVVQDVAEGTDVLWRHHDLTWRPAGEVLAPVWTTDDPSDRNVTDYLFNDPAGPSWNTGFVVSREPQRRLPLPLEVLTGELGTPAKDTIAIEEVKVAEVSTIVARIRVAPPKERREEKLDYGQIWNGSEFVKRALKKVMAQLGKDPTGKNAVIVADFSGFDGDPRSLMKTPLNWGRELEEAVQSFLGKVTLVVATRRKEGTHVVFTQIRNPGRAVVGGSKTQDAAPPVGPAASSIVKQLAGGNDETLRKAETVYDGIHAIDRAWHVGTILQDDKKKTPYPVEALMEAIGDQDAPPPIPRWENWTREGADLVKVRETLVGGVPSMMIGIEARPLPREEEPPPSYPSVWRGSTLYPGGSKKMARAINAANAAKVRQDLVIVANLSGFDGSAESLRKMQLEWGAEIEEAVREFRGRIVFLVTTRYHGGAYVVFSRVLNPGMAVGAVEGTFASVIGGNVAVQVIADLKREVDRRATAREVTAEVQALLAKATPEEAVKIRGEIRAEEEEKYAQEYDQTHNVERARKVGSIDDIVPPHRIRPWIIEQLLTGREEASNREEQRIELLIGAYTVFFARQGGEGIALWEGLVRAAGLGPFMPRMKDEAARRTPPPPPRRPEGGVPPPTGDQLSLDTLALKTLGEGPKLLNLEVPEGRVGAKILSFDRVTSTMDVLRRLATERTLGQPTPGTVVIADEQEQGRGREGRRWESPPRNNLLLSAWIKPDLPPEKAHRLSMAVTAAIHQAVGELAEQRPTVKWPNDIYVGDQKIAGILIDSIPEGDGFNVGIGLNVNSPRSDFSAELQDRVTSLFLSTRRTWNREFVLKVLLEKLNYWVDLLNEGESGWGEILAYIRTNSYLIGKKVQVIRGGMSVEGEFEEIASDGALIIRDRDDNLHRVDSGDLTVL